MSRTGIPSNLNMLHNATRTLCHMYSRIKKVDGFVHMYRCVYHTRIYFLILYLMHQVPLDVSFDFEVHTWMLAGNEIYFFGIINFLSVYDSKKQSKTWFKRLFNQKSAIGCVSHLFCVTLHVLALISNIGWHTSPFHHVWNDFLQLVQF